MLGLTVVSLFERGGLLGIATHPMGGICKASSQPLFPTSAILMHLPLLGFPHHQPRFLTGSCRPAVYISGSKTGAGPVHAAGVVQSANPAAVIVQGRSE